MTTLAPVGGLIGKGGNAVGGVDTTIQIWGMQHLVILGVVTVQVFLAGHFCGDFTPDANGSITVTLGTGAPDNFNSPTLAQVIAADAADWGEQTCPIVVHNNGTSTIHVPVVIGPAIVSQGQVLRPAEMPSGPALAKTRRSHMFGALLQNAMVVRFGTVLGVSTGNLIQATFRQADRVTALPINTPFNGVYWDTLADDYTFDGEICWQVDAPFPCTVCALTSFMHVQER